MSDSTVKSFIEQIQLQTRIVEKLFATAGLGTENDRTGEVLGDPEASLTVRGNIGDLAFVNHIWFLNARDSGVLTGDIASGLPETVPAGFPELRSYLAPRETLSGEEILTILQGANDAWVQALGRISDDRLDAPVTTLFGTYPLHMVLLRLVLHGGMHVGQAWGILKGVGVTREGLEYLFS